METNQFIKATIGIIVAFVILAVVAIPIIGGFTESSDGSEEENEIISFRYAAIPKSGTTLVLTGGPNDSAASFEIGGEEIPVLQGLSFGNYALCRFDQYELRDTSDPSGSQLILVNSFDLLYENGKLTGTMNIRPVGSSATDMEIDIEDPMVVGYFLNISSFNLDWVDVLMTAWNDGGEFHINQNSPLLVADFLPYAKGTIHNMTDLFESTYSIDTEPTDNESLIVTSFTTSSPTTYLYVPISYYTESPTMPTISGPIADMVNLIPLLLVVGMVLAVLATYITLKFREGGA